ncbi:MAG: hypothetical protein KIT22_06290 [Verrucomicrobiae bacterium]|nr:hypothetical protein [Verrucomicrobiae bacterium]
MMRSLIKFAPRLRRKTGDEIGGMAAGGVAAGAESVVTRWDSSLFGSRI